MLTIVELSENGKIMKRIRVLDNIVAVESTETGVEIIINTGKTYQYSLTFGLIDIGRMQSAMKGSNYAMVVWKDQYYLDTLSGWSLRGFVAHATKEMGGDEE